jgi:hypothetical protein
MIGIRDYIEDGLELEHYQNIKNYVKGVVQFYLNIIAIIDGDLDIDEFDKGIEFEFDFRHYNGWFNAVSKKNNDFKNLFNAGNLKWNHLKEDFYKINLELEELLKSFLDSNHDLFIKKIITAEPGEQKDIIDKFSNYDFARNGLTRSESIDYINIILNKIFDYNKFVNGSGYFKKWNAYDLAKKLDVNVCPYCNRLYTATIVSNSMKITRPEFDHYLRKSKYPYLALSFFNLIPSCKVCNSQLKKEVELPIDKDHHPYLKIDNRQLIFSFDLNNLDVLSGKSEELEVTFNKKNAGINFDGKLKEIYNGHSDIVADLIYKRHIYSDELVEEINELIPDDKISKKEIIRSLFAMPINEKEIVNLSLGKLKTNIMKELFDL